jgi:hypothetical protein
MATARRRRPTRAQMLANPAQRATLPDSALSPIQRLQRHQARARKAAGSQTNPATADPLAPVSSLKDLTTQANQLVDAQTGPDTSTLGQQETTENQQYATRTGLAQGLAGFQQQDTQKAFADTQAALNNLISLSSATGTQDQANLQAALKASDDARAAMYAGAGAAPPPPGTLGQDQTPQLLAGVASQFQGGQNALVQTGQGQITAAGAREAMPGQALALNLRDITGEHTANMKSIQQKRDDIQKQRPNLLRQAVRDLQDFEIVKRQFGDAHASQLFQQFLADKQLGNQEKDASFQQWLATSGLTGTTAPGGPVPAGQTTLAGRAQNTSDRVAVAGVTGRDPRTGRPTLQARDLSRQWQDRLAGRQIDWANVGINQQQVNAQLAAVAQQAQDAGDKKKSDEAAKRGAGITAGIEALAGYMGTPPSNVRPDYPAAQAVPATAAIPDNPSTPQNEAKPATKGQDAYKRTFDGAMRVLELHMSRSDALRILMKSNYSDWRARANYLSQRSKRRGRSGPTQRPTGTHSGGSGRFGPN